ncbi:MAG: hypothetical protein KGL39_14495 [Patescibacteria group bacterium]|nr:hypothetical protein [Patescibacteria group bacterium]
MADEETQPQEAPATPAAAAQSDVTPQEPQTDAPQKTFTQEDVNRILAERLKGYSGIGKPEEVQQKLKQLEELQKFKESVSRQVNPAPAPQPRQLTPEQQRVRDYLAGIDPAYAELPRAVQEMRAVTQQFYLQQAKVTGDQASSQVAALAKEAGYPETLNKELESRIASAIAQNQEDLKRFVNGGTQEVVKKHFEMLDKLIRGASPAKGTQYAAAKKETKNLPPRVAGGAAGTSSPKPPREMSNKDFLTAAYSALQGK